MARKTEIVKFKGDWQDVVDGCRITVNKPPLGHEPSKEFKYSMLIAEHEPIRELWVKWKWLAIAYCIAMHWKTHIWPSRVNTSREDRTGVPRNKRSQVDPVNFEASMNPQHSIDTFRKRLCCQADPDTRLLAEDFKITLHAYQPEWSDVLVPNCVYRCGCPEPKMCEKRLWASFTAWAHARHVNVFRMSIKDRYALYNKWFYEEWSSYRDA